MPVLRPTFCCSLLGLRSLWTVVRLVGVLVGVIVSARALSVTPPSFEELVAGSSQVVRLQVDRVSSRWDVTPQGSVIRTYVECRVLRTLKGPEGPTITLRFLGGRVGEEAMIIAEMPTLEEGVTYIVFLSENGRAFCPLVSAQHGLYPVVRDPATREEFVTRSNGQRLRAVDDVQTPIVAQSSHPAFRLGTGAGMSRQEFEDAVLGELNRPAVKAAP
jgi:hypothetical protein